MESQVNTGQKWTAESRLPAVVADDRFLFDPTLGVASTDAEFQSRFVVSDILAPSVVTCSVWGSFRAPSVRELVLVRVNHIDLYQLEGDHSVQLISSTRLFGDVISIAAVGNASAQRDALVVVTSDPCRVSVLLHDSCPTLSGVTTSASTFHSWRTVVAYDVTVPQFNAGDELKVFPPITAVSEGSEGLVLIVLGNRWLIVLPTGCSADSLTSVASCLYRAATDRALDSLPTASVRKPERIDLPGLPETDSTSAEEFKNGNGLPESPLVHRSDKRADNTGDVEANWAGDILDLRSLGIHSVASACFLNGSPSPMVLLAFDESTPPYTQPAVPVPISVSAGVLPVKFGTSAGLGMKLRLSREFVCRLGGLPFDLLRLMPLSSDSASGCVVTLYPHTIGLVSVTSAGSVDMLPLHPSSPAANDSISTRSLGLDLSEAAAAFVGPLRFVVITARGEALLFFVSPPSSAVKVIAHGSSTVGPTSDACIRLVSIIATENARIVRIPPSAVPVEPDDPMDSVAPIPVQDSLAKSLPKLGFIRKPTSISAAPAQEGSHAVAFVGTLAGHWAIVRFAISPSADGSCPSESIEASPDVPSSVINTAKPLLVCRTMSPIRSVSAGALPPLLPSTLAPVVSIVASGCAPVGHISFVRRSAQPITTLSMPIPSATACFLGPPGPVVVSLASSKASPAGCTWVFVGGQRNTKHAMCTSEPTLSVLQLAAGTIALQCVPSAVRVVHDLKNPESIKCVDTFAAATFCPKSRSLSTVRSWQSDHMTQLERVGWLLGLAVMLGDEGDVAIVSFQAVAEVKPIAYVCKTVQSARSSSIACTVSFCPQLQESYTDASLVVSWASGSVSLFTVSSKGTGVLDAVETAFFSSVGLDTTLLTSWPSGCGDDGDVIMSPSAQSGTSECHSKIIDMVIVPYLAVIALAADGTLAIWRCLPLATSGASNIRRYCKWITETTMSSVANPTAPRTCRRIFSLPTASPSFQFLVCPRALGGSPFLVSVSDSLSGPSIFTHPVASSFGVEGGVCLLSAAPPGPTSILPNFFMAGGAYTLKVSHLDVRFKLDAPLLECTSTVPYTPIFVAFNSDANCLLMVGEEELPPPVLSRMSAIGPGARRSNFLGVHHLVCYVYQDDDTNAVLGMSTSLDASQNSSSCLRELPGGLRLGSGEFVVGMKCLSLATSCPHTGSTLLPADDPRGARMVPTKRVSTFVVSTALPAMESTLCVGRLILLTVDVADSGKASRLQVLHQEHMKFAVTAFDSIGGYLLTSSTYRTKLYYFDHEAKALIPASFIDPVTAVPLSISVLPGTQYFAIGDVSTGVTLLRLRMSMQHLRIVASSVTGFPANQTGFIVSDAGAMCVLATDTSHSFRAVVHLHNIDLEASGVSLPLQQSVSVSLGSPGYVTAMLPVRAASPLTTGKSQIGSLIATNTGALVSIIPISRASYQNLRWLNAHITEAIPVVGALHPIGHRVIPSYLPDAVIDDAIIAQYLGLSPTKRDEFAGDQVDAIAVVRLIAHYRQSLDLL